MTLIISYDPSLWSLINVTMVTSYVSVASFAALVYDWALTFGQEVELVWRQHWSLMTVLYLSIRYIGMPFLLFMILVSLPSLPTTDLGCTVFLFNIRWLSVVVNPMLCVIMIARLYAMYQRSRRIFVFLVVVCLSLTIASLIIAIMTQDSNFAEEVVISGIIHWCTSLEANSFFLVPITWILGTAWEVIALCLAIWIAVKHFKELQRPSTGWTVGDCFAVLVKTHVFYFASFAVVACFHLGTLSATLYYSDSMGATLYFGFLQFAAGVQMFVLGPRLILGVREYHANLITNADAGIEMNSIVFQERVDISTSSVV